jgi:uncharacterized protein YbaR (Trm112 family)
MIDPAFLAMLVCPVTRQPLRQATPDEVTAVNASIAGGAVTNRGGTAVREAIEAGLATEDGSDVYPIRDDIPILLAAEAIPLPPHS